MNKEFLEVLHLLEEEKGIPFDYMIENVKEGIKKAVENDYKDGNIVVEIDPKSGELKVFLQKNVVEEVEDEATEIAYTDAVKYNTAAVVGSVVDIPIDLKEDLRRISALNAKNVIRQGIREAERNYLYAQLKNYKHEILTATVSRIDPEREDAIVEVVNSEVLLPKREQVPGELLSEGDRIKVYVVDVFSPPAANGTGKPERSKGKDPKIMISRTHPGLVKRLFEMEVPEIYDGTVEIKAIAREAGSRTKIAVYSGDPNVDPVGACIGMDGGRVKNIVKELGGEKLEIVKYSEDPVEFITAALSPASVVSVEVDPEGTHSCTVTVPDSQLSLAIGNKGQSARLTAKLTGWKIDIKPESGYYTGTEK